MIPKRVNVVCLTSMSFSDQITATKTSCLVANTTTATHDNSSWTQKQHQGPYQLSAPFTGV